MDEELKQSIDKLSESVNDLKTEIGYLYEQLVHHRNSNSDLTASIDALVEELKKKQS